MAEDTVRQFPVTAENTEVIPTGPKCLRALDRKSTTELTKRDLLAGIYTVVDELYDEPVMAIELRDTLTARVTFEDGTRLRTELVTDEKRVTAEDVRPLVEMRPHGTGLLVVTATSWVRHDVRRLADQRGVDVVSVTPEPFASTGSQLAVF